jgi:HEAT repeat protein
MQVGKTFLCGIVVSFFLAPVAGAQSRAVNVENAWAILKDGTAANSLEDRVAAIRALGLIDNDARARELALAALKDDKPQARAAGAEALGAMQARETAPRLREVVKSDPDVTVVITAAQALVELGDESGYEVYYAVLTGQMKSGKSLVEQQKEMLHDPKKLAEFGFTTGIGFVPFAGAGWTAYKLISKDDVSPVRAAAAKELTNDPDPQSEKGLESVLGDKSWLVRQAAVSALAHRGDPAVVPQLLPVLTDDKAPVRFSAAAAVIRLSKPGVRYRRPPSNVR